MIRYETQSDIFYEIEELMKPVEEAYKEYGMGDSYLYACSRFYEEMKDIVK